jgi:hypothetical protein
MNSNKSHWLINSILKRTKVKMTRQQKHKGRRNEPLPQNVFRSLRHVDEHELIEQKLCDSHRRPMSALARNTKKQVARCAPSFRTLKIVDERDALEQRNKQDEAIYKEQDCNYMVFLEFLSKLKHVDEHEKVNGFELGSPPPQPPLRRWNCMAQILGRRRSSVHHRHETVPKIVTCILLRV